MQEDIKLRAVDTQSPDKQLDVNDLFTISTLKEALKQELKGIKIVRLIPDEDSLMVTLEIQNVSGETNVQKRMVSYV